MKKFWLRIFILLLTTGASARGLGAASVELRQIVDGTPSPKIDFDNLSTSIQYNLSKQYLKIETTDDSIKAARFLIKNSSNGSYGGLNSAGNGVLPLYWASFPLEQTPNQTNFSEETENSWKTVLNLESPSSSWGESSTIPLQPGKANYIYFGIKMPLGSAVQGEYSAELYVELLKRDPTPEEIKPKQNIITPNADNINDIAKFSLAKGATIKIFDIHGRLVRTLEETDYWDGKDNDSQTVESGVYVYYVKSGDVTVSGMLAVER